MIRNAWAFAVHSQYWMPLPRLSQLDAEYRDRWLATAQQRIERANLALGEEAAALTPLCEALLDRVTEDEKCVYFPVMEPYPLVIDIVTRTSDEIRSLREEWQRKERPETRAVETTPVDHDSLTDAVRIMRVQETREGLVEYSVGFFGASGSLGVALIATTDQPLVAGQFAGAGLSVFSTFKRREADVSAA